MVYGELGETPLHIDIKCKMVSYWASLITSKENKLSKMIYSLIYNLYEKDLFYSNWISSVKTILDSAGFSAAITVYQSKLVVGLKLSATYHYAFTATTSVMNTIYVMLSVIQRGGGPRVVVSTAAFHARVRGSVPGLGGLKETKMFLPHPRVKVSIAGSLRD